jgi:hypothetical protein
MPAADSPIRRDRELCHASASASGGGGGGGGGASTAGHHEGVGAVVDADTGGAWRWCRIFEGDRAFTITMAISQSVS